jgi:hypothetical protein
VKQGQNLSIVAACGLQAPGDTYEHFSADPVNGVLQKTAKAVEPLARGEELLAGVPRNNFRGFMGSLQNYCPTGYFFDPQIPGCAFVNSGSPLAVSARKTVIVGFDAYRPACCQACKDCERATLKKDMSSWQQCTGNSVEDVQDRCGYVSKEAVVLIGRQLDLPPSKVYGVATFYNQFRFHPPGRFGEVSLTADGRVESFNEKPQTEAGYINGGFMVCEPQLFDYLSADPQVMLEEAPLRRLAAEGKLAACRHEGFWQPMDTYQEFALLNRLWSEGRAPWAG